MCICVVLLFWLSVAYFPQLVGVRENKNHHDTSSVTPCFYSPFLFSFSSFLFHTRHPTARHRCVLLPAAYPLAIIFPTFLFFFSPSFLLLGRCGNMTSIMYLRYTVYSVPDTRVDEVRYIMRRLFRGVGVFKTGRADLVVAGGNQCVDQLDRKARRKGQMFFFLWMEFISPGTSFIRVDGGIYGVV